VWIGDRANGTVKGAKGRAGSRSLGRSGATALEFGIIAIPFFAWFLFIFELSFDMFQQAALDNALATALDAVQRGNAQYVQNGQSFINQYLCPALSGRLECQNLYINVTAPTFTGTQDFYDVTTGAIPSSGGSLLLAGYSGASSFCNAQPGQFLLISVIYVGPSFIGAILPGILSLQYNGRTVHPTMSTAAIVVEPWNPATYTGTTTPAPSC
jgi:pilus assembly protein Flp/PilA